ncbi:MAG: Asp-tRNA(Asn)/Glu-tRNA(Gln) amidotransferase subunit GatB [Candidatus Omnitrophota bacterium]|nr:Asp-tRNA(Asn)/Glu-tRNA(Gln) amidotransferase subunit GatB [Candidatus Omnitrophota bacterium]
MASARIPVIGLEVHLQMKTASKIFCGCSTQFGAPPNSQVCPVCLGLPGVLPVLNHQVFLYGVRVSLALGCRIQSQIVFHRKNYFYPDLPKGYQISQYNLPLGTAGAVDLPSGKKVRIMRAHLEEDAGKLLHRPEGGSLVDLNRAGVPLLEIVTEPDLESPEQAYEYLKTLKGILESLDVSDCDMEKGSLRCDANISLKTDEGKLGTRSEIKNLNSFRSVARAIAYEIKRQGELLDEGGKVVQETRLWDDAKGVTQGMRSKEFAHDYRYFPEPDLVPFAVAEKEIEQARAALPELPRQRAERFVRQYSLSLPDAVGLTSSRSTADYYEASVKKRPAASKVLANWILGDLAREINERNADRIEALNFGPERLVELVELIDSGKISGKMAKEVLIESLNSKQSPKAVVDAKGLSQVTDKEAIKVAAREVIQEQPKAVADFKQGKQTTLMFLVGQLMRKMKGAASPALSQEVLKELIEKG